MRGKWLGSLAVVLSVWCMGTRADDPQWRPSATTRPIVVAATPNASGPGVSLGKPIARTGTAPVAEPQFPSVGHQSSASPIIRAQGFDGGPPPVPPPGVPSVPGGPVGPIGPGGVPPVPTGPGGPTPPDPLCGPGCIDPYGGVGGPGAPGPGGFMNNNQFQQWFGWCGEWNRPLFQSDHCFDGFASPVSNPFWSEDPRSLTEIRPIFIYARASDNNLPFGNLSTEFFGTQMRLALTDNLSIVMHKLGGIWGQPGDSALPGYDQDFSSFSEITVGPKFTFLRNKETQSVAAVGVSFDIPTGKASAFQNTPSLSVRPYLSYAQSFGRSSFGSFNAMTTVGYSFGFEDRTDNFFANLHLDYNIGNLNRIYPLIEVNWTHYTDDGKNAAMPWRTEGRDLYNLGSTNISGHDDVSMAAGLRYKFREWAQVGAAFEFPLSGNGDLSQFRTTIDFILRY